VRVAQQRQAMRACRVWPHAQAPSASAAALASQSERLRSGVTERYGASVREVSLTVRQRGCLLAALPATTNALLATKALALPILASPCALRHAAMRRHDAKVLAEPRTRVACVHVRMRMARATQRAR